MYMSFPQFVYILWKKCVNYVLSTVMPVNVASCCDLGLHCITNSPICQYTPPSTCSGTVYSFPQDSEYKTVRHQ